MATKKAKEATATDESSKPSSKPEPFLTNRTGVDIIEADRSVLQKPIDDRMAALLKDHQAMGARPTGAEQKKLDKAGE